MSAWSSIISSVCQFYRSFQRTSSFFHWFFSIAFLVYFMDFCSLLFLSPACFGFIFLFFYRSWGGSFRLFFGDFSTFLMYTFSAINFPPSTALTVFYRFWYGVFSFSFSSMYFLKISLETFFLTHGLFRSVLFSLPIGDFLDVLFFFLNIFIGV